jgi:asparagine synthase (glutamine-hydrolysing)
MGGIASLVWLDGRDARTLDLSPALVSMARRAPGGWSCEAYGPATLASGPSEPSREFVCLGTAGRDARYAVAWDGRLDNRPELLHDLAQRSVQIVPEATDAELLIATYGVYGKATPGRLLGDFAFALYDRLTRTMFCARDPVGARPLYTVETPAFFAVASEDDALSMLPGVSKSLYSRRQIYANNGWFSAFPWHRSWYRDIRIAKPGVSLLVEINTHGRVVEHEFFKWQPSTCGVVMDEREATEEFRRLLDLATKDRIRGVTKIGVIASGGVDSASVALSARRACVERPIHQFSAVNDDESCLETRAILALHEQLSTELHCVSVPSFVGECTRADVAEFHREPHPVLDTLALLGMMCLMAKRQGVRTLLHGVSGDLLLHAPSDYIFRYAAERGWRQAVAEARAANLHHTYNRTTGVLKMLCRSAYFECMPPSLKVVWRRLSWDRKIEIPPHQSERRMGIHRRSVLAAEMTGQLASERAIRCVPRNFSELAHAMFPVGIPRGLEGYERVAGRYGVELRDPLADQRLIQFALDLPVSLRTNLGWTKRLLRLYCDRQLPDVCVWRSDRTHLGHFFFAGAV